MDSLPKVESAPFRHLDVPLNAVACILFTVNATDSFYHFTFSMMHVKTLTQFLTLQLFEFFQISIQSLNDMYLECNFVSVSHLGSQQSQISFYIPVLKLHVELLN